MKYKEQLTKAREEKLNIAELAIAEECDNTFTFDYNEDEFEQLCELVKECYYSDMTGAIMPHHIAHTINTLIVDDEQTIIDVLYTNKWDILCKASYLL